MQAGKSAIGSVKESAANIAASAKSGLDKTKAVLEEKSEKLRAHDPLEKEMAKERKEEKINRAEMEKQEKRENNAAARQQYGGAAGGTPAGVYDVGHGHSHSHAATGAAGHSTGTHQMSALPGHGTGQPAGGHVAEGAAGTHSVGMNAGNEMIVESGARGGSETRQGYN